MLMCGMCYLSDKTTSIWVEDRWKLMMMMMISCNHFGCIMSILGRELVPMLKDKRKRHAGGRMVDIG